MTLAAALSAVVWAQPALKPSAYPSASMLAAFESTCGDLISFQSRSSALPRDGWERIVVDSPASELSRLVRIMKRGMSLRPGITVFDSAAFSRMIAGRRVYATLSDAKVGSAGGMECAIFDLNNDMRFPREAAESWMKRAATNSAVGSNGFWTDWWTPGKTAQQTIVQIEYWPSGDDESGLLRGMRFFASALPPPETDKRNHKPLN